MKDRGPQQLLKKHDVILIAHTVINRNSPDS
jgi:hypothetical protein